MATSFTYHPSSFRDPAGFVFEKEKILYRQVNKIFREHFDFFVTSGCYEKLVRQQLLVPHKQINENLTGSDEWYTTLRPDPIAFISYPWEWSFDMLKDAALLTLKITKDAVDGGMILKDATPYNIQWHKGKLIFIDTLSFEKYDPREPWIAYRQFCENFLAPLMVMHYAKQAMPQLTLAWPEGIPLRVARSLLPGRSKFSLHNYLHIHLHAKIAARKSPAGKSTTKFSRQKLLNLITSLEIVTRKLKLPDQSTAWSDYYSEASQRNNYLDEKKRIIAQWLDGMQGLKTAADLGANDGEFSRLLSAKGICTLSADLDPYCMNHLYKNIRSSGEKNIQPLIMDLSNPSPSVGFINKERTALTARLHTDLSLALALVHHLAIGKNITFTMIAELLKDISPVLIIEFIPKSDEKLRMMLAGKKDIYAGYTQENFEKIFSAYYRLEKKEEVADSGRTLYRMKRYEG